VWQTDRRTGDSIYAL